MRRLVDCLGCQNSARYYLAIEQHAWATPRNGDAFVVCCEITTSTGESGKDAIGLRAVFSPDPNSILFRCFAGVDLGVT